ncbi:unknown [Bacteroides sp. CAG:20]|nr:unknown [Bacteroides sp. CAG:20]
MGIPPIFLTGTLCTSPLCFVAQNIGEKQRSDSDEEGDWKDDMPRIV